MVKFIESVIVENKLREFTKSDFYMYGCELFQDGSRPLIYSSDNYDVVVCSAYGPNVEENNKCEVLIEDEDHEYYKIFKNKKAAVRYAELIINKLNNTKSIYDTALDLGFEAI